jgi:hypothetical protein
VSSERIYYNSNPTELVHLSVVSVSDLFTYIPSYSSLLLLLFLGLPASPSASEDEPLLLEEETIAAEAGPAMAAALAAAASSSLFLLLWEPEGATPVRSFSASSDVKLIKVASPQLKPPPEGAGLRLPEGDRFEGEALEALRWPSLAGEEGMRAMGRIVPG